VGSPPGDPTVQKQTLTNVKGCSKRIQLFFESFNCSFVKTWILRRRQTIYPNGGSSPYCPHSKYTSHTEGRLPTTLASLLPVQILGAHLPDVLTLYRTLIQKAWCPPCDSQPLPIPMTHTTQTDGRLSTRMEALLSPAQILDTTPQQKADYLPEWRHLSLLCRFFVHL